MFVIFSCFGCVVINHQKQVDCKENGPWVFWLKGFWCLMINITCGLMRLLVFVFIVHWRRKEAVTRRSRAVAPDSLGNGRIQWSTAIDPNGRLTCPGHRTVTVHVWYAMDCPVRPSTEQQISIQRL
jgi:hypothetical protein